MTLADVSFCRCDRRGGTSSMCDLRARAPMPHQWHRVQGRLARSQRWHHQLWQLPICHADSVSVYHHGGLDRRAVLGKSLDVPSQFNNLWLSYAFSLNVLSDQTHNNNVTDILMKKLLIMSWGNSYHSDVIDWLNDWMHSTTHLTIWCYPGVVSIPTRSLFFLVWSYWYLTFALFFSDNFLF